MISRPSHWLTVIATGILIHANSVAADVAATPENQKPAAAKANKSAPKLDRSGKPRKGDASYYAKRFAGRKMADGTPMNPQSNIAASKTLPLGTKAQVTNLENGKSAEVEIRDRGPYVDGRIVDLTPKVAKELGIVEQGVAAVEVRPIEVPQADGSIKTADRTAVGSSNLEKTASGAP